MEKNNTHPNRNKSIEIFKTNPVAVRIKVFLKRKDITRYRLDEAGLWVVLRGRQGIEYSSSEPRILSIVEGRYVDALYYMLSTKVDDYFADWATLPTAPSNGRVMRMTPLKLLPRKKLLEKVL